MALKIYGIHGRSTAVIRVPAGDGKAYLEVEFTKGRPTPGGNYKPAVYSTNDKTEQSIIEHSPYFGGTIKLIQVYGNDSDAAAPAPAPAVEAPKAAEPKVYPDVETYEQAVVVLKSLGAKATQLRSTDAIRKFMSTMNVSFPNYNFE